LALLPNVLGKFAGSGGKLVWARVVSIGGVAARLNMARRTPTEQSAKATRARGLKRPIREFKFLRMAVRYSLR
jgi:hypothetical protein